MGKVFIFSWILLWILCAVFIRRKKGSWLTTIGGGFLASLIVLFVISMLKPAIDQLIYPNPSVKNWKISEPQQAANLWKEDRGEKKSIFQNSELRSGAGSSNNRISVSSLDYGSRWSFTVDRGELECVGNAVIMHTSKGTYSINGKAMDRYAGRYPEWRRIAKPQPGLEHDPQAKMPPPHDLIQKGLALCK